MLRALGLALGVPAGRAPGGLGGGLETGSAGSTALVSRTSGWRLDARVFEEPGQYKGCPSGQRNARENECLAAVTAATHAEGLALAYPYAVKYVDRGPDDLVPGGCSYSKRHGQRAMWNRNPSGRSTASYPLVCIDDVLSTSPAPTPSPEPAPVASEGGWTLDPRVHEEPGQFTGCPDGQRNAAESECVAAVQDALLSTGETLGHHDLKVVDAGADGWVPAGCSYSRGHGQRAMFNRNPAGRSSGSYPLVCIGDATDNEPCPSCVGPRAIVHVGPHKVGSTSLQAALQQHRDEFARDNFDLLPDRFESGFFDGPKSGANVANCLSGKPRGATNCTRVLDQLGRFLDHARRAKRGVILSSEEFDRPDVDMPALATALRGFDTTIVVMHRPYFEWLQSYYSELHPSLSLEEFASADRIVGAAAGEAGWDQYCTSARLYNCTAPLTSVQLYNRYKQQFRSVRMSNLAEGYIRDFVCSIVQANATCRLLESARETHANTETGEFAYPGCMPARQKELLWTVSVGIEAQAQALIGPGLSVQDLSALRDRFAQAPYRLCS